MMLRRSFLSGAFATMTLASQARVRDSGTKLAEAALSRLGELRFQQAEDIEFFFAQRLELLVNLAGDFGFEGFPHRSTEVGFEHRRMNVALAANGWRVT